MQGKLKLADVAERCGISDKTLYNWRQKPEFEQAVAEAMGQTVDERLFERILATGEPSAITLYYRRHGLFKDADTEVKVLQMKEDERERIARECYEWYRNNFEIKAATFGS